MMAINARSTFLCYKHAAKQMIAQGRGGRIIGPKVSDPSPVDVESFHSGACSAAGKKGFSCLCMIDNHVSLTSWEQVLSSLLRTVHPSLPFAG